MSAEKNVILENVRGSLWAWPAVSSIASLAVVLALLPLRPEPGSGWDWLWLGDAPAALALLQTVASSIMTATTLAFSLTVVALQMASQQFSPRLLREFARDPITQAALSVLMSTFVAAVIVIRSIHEDVPLPVFALALVMVLGVVSGLALLAFLGHLVRSLRVETMMLRSHEGCAETIAETYPPLGDTTKEPQPGLPGPEGGALVPSRRSGFIREVDPAPLVEAARKQGLFLRLGVRPGDHVTEGAPILAAWNEDGAASVSLDDDAIEAALAESVIFGFERTMEQDAALGLRQLTDIAVKAISPSINDPVTAAHAVGYCGDLVSRLQQRRLGEQQHLDSTGRPRLVTPDRDHRYYLDLVCGPIRRFGASETIVLTALLRMLRDCAANARSDEQRAELRRQAELVVAQADDKLLEYDFGPIRDLAVRVEQALSGDLDAAYRDRASETRSV